MKLVIPKKQRSTPKDFAAMLKIAEGIKAPFEAGAPKVWAAWSRRKLVSGKFKGRWQVLRMARRADASVKKHKEVK